MADDEDVLDDLFGALDGDEETTKDEEPQKKKIKLDESQPKVAEPQKLVDFQSIMQQRILTSQPSVVPVAATAAAQVAHGSKTVTSSKSSAAASPNPSTESREVGTGTSHDKTVRSYSALPADYVVPTAPDRPPAKTYPFKLDPFQQQAVDYIERGESVLVAAHTSAGKTAVAEYSIALSLQNSQRVIYTSPIKALSNQKFRDLQEEFQDVGLMTGDISINPDATVLVMTTEILRSMLYRGSEIIREVAWVVYDEVHYMRDSERGVVWEESIILLPDSVRFVFLSATIPNAKQFADWICKIHRQPCHIVYTNYRPTPLQHYVFPQGGDGLHLVVDEKGKFRESNFRTAMGFLQDSVGGSGHGGPYACPG